MELWESILRNHLGGMVFAADYVTVIALRPHHPRLLHPRRLCLDPLQLSKTLSEVRVVCSHQKTVKGRGEVLWVFVVTQMGFGGYDMEWVPVGVLG